MRFYLPAFLIADLQGQFRFDLVYTFIYLDEYKEQQFSLLNAQQKQAVAQYLMCRIEGAPALHQTKTL